MEEHYYGKRGENITNEMIGRMRSLAPCQDLMADDIYVPNRFILSAFSRIKCESSSIVWAKVQRFDFHLFALTILVPRWGLDLI